MSTTTYESCISWVQQELATSRSSVSRKVGPDRSMNICLRENKIRTKKVLQQISKKKS